MGGQGGQAPLVFKTGGGRVSQAPPVFFTSIFHRLIVFRMNATIHSTDSFARCYKNKLLIQTTVINYHLIV